MVHKLFTAALLLLLFVAALGSAQQSLDSGTVNRWADSMDAIERWGEGQPDVEESFEEPEDPSDFEASLAEIAHQNAEVRRIISRHGFSGVDQWANVGSRIIYAYGAVQMGEMAPGMEQELKQQMEELENNENLTEEQREMMREQFEQAMGMMSGVSDVPDEDKAAIRANRSRLDKLFNDEE